MHSTQRGVRASRSFLEALKHLTSHLVQVQKGTPSHVAKARERPAKVLREHADLRALFFVCECVPCGGRSSGVASCVACGE